MYAVILVDGMNDIENRWDQGAPIVTRANLAECRLAKALVDKASATGEEPTFASWF